MRADRLLSLLMLLQSRGRMTGRQLARELEGSERTIYRDIDALSTAGVPVYGDPGPQGGYQLLDSYRSDLTGLAGDEVRALFMLSVPQPLADLGVSRELAAALRKLAAALPGDRREDEHQVRRRFHLDAAGWDQTETSAPHLPAVHQAVWQDRRLYLAYRIHGLAVNVEQTVDPYGLVAKAGAWHLVYAVRGAIPGAARGGDQVLRVLPVSALLDARLTGESFERPASFDLAQFWKEWCAARASGRIQYLVTLRVAPDFLPELPVHFGELGRARLAEAGPPDARGWVTLQLPFESLDSARARILGFGRGVEVLAPAALRWSIVDYAGQITALYGA